MNIRPLIDEIDKWNLNFVIEDAYEEGQYAFLDCLAAALVEAEESGG